MNKKLLFGIVGVCFLLFSAAGVAALEFKTEKFALNGSGSLMDSPPYFFSTVISGTLSPGTFIFWLDDTGWPTDDIGTPNNERWDFIFSNYFIYDSTIDNEGWDGKFPSSTLGETAPSWRCYTEAGDTLGGLCSDFTITIRDYNGNGILDDNEYINKVFSAGLVCYINYGKGCFTSFCGQGSCSGTLDLVDEETWEEELYVPSATSASGRLDLRDVGCETGVAPSNWGQIKSIHRD